MKRRLLYLLFAGGMILPLLTLPGTAHTQDVAADLLGRINGLRVSLGLPPYTLNAALTAAALNQAQWMAATGQVSHTQSDGSTPSSRAAAAGYPSTWVSENIYMGTLATAETAWNWWLNSPIHYRGITSLNYSEIGIASASGEGGRAFVLVFGNPNGLRPAAPASGSSGGGNSGPASQPPYVVGVDSHGNIMHEIQPGHTVGDIALIYGYTWDDIPYMLALNGMTPEDARELEIGSVFLVPPHAGTYTPTPDANAGPSGSTPSAPTPPSEIPPQHNVIVTVTPATATPSPAAGVVVTSAVVPEWVIQTSEALVASPSPTASAPVAAAGTPQWIASTVTPGGTAVAMAAVQTPAGSGLEPVAAQVVVRERIPPLLLAAVFVQLGILALAGAEFIRRSRGR